MSFEYAYFINTLAYPTSQRPQLSRPSLSERRTAFSGTRTSSRPFVTAAQAVSPAPLEAQPAIDNAREELIRI